MTEAVEACKELLRVGKPFFAPSKGRMLIYINSRQRFYSHYVWFQNTGHWPNYDKDEVIHHIDGNKLNDAFGNLLLMTRSEHNAYCKEQQLGERKFLKTYTYKQIRINGKTKLFSHYIWHLNTSHWPVWPEVIHHKDGDIRNDNFDNLLLMTRAEHDSGI